MGWLASLIGCEAATAPGPGSDAVPPITPGATATVTMRATIQPKATLTASDARFNVNATQAELVHVIVSFVQAYNQGRVEEALALLDDQITGSDCDYARVTTIFFKGKPEAEAWLRARKADADQLTIERIVNENPGDTHVAAVSFARRTSNTLRSLGFAQGITPKLAAKVVVFSEPTRIIAFANGPGGGDQNYCRTE